MNPTQNPIVIGAGEGHASALISPCGLYRYRLDRAVGVGPTVAFLMVNPSTADGERDDATIRKVVGFSLRAGFGHVVVGNKFARRATDIRDLRGLSGAEARGPDNDHHLKRILCDAAVVIAAWGPLGKLPPTLRNRWRTVVQLAAQFERPLQCLGVAADGHPRHPLMLSYDTPLTDWRPPA